MPKGPKEQQEACERRGWHMCRRVESPDDAEHAAVCIKCGEMGTIAWAVPNALKETDARDAFCGSDKE